MNVTPDSETRMTRRELVCALSAAGLGAAALGGTRNRAIPHERESAAIDIERRTAAECAIEAAYRDSVSGEIVGTRFNLRTGRGICDPRMFQNGRWRKRIDVLWAPEVIIDEAVFSLGHALTSLEVVKETAEEKTVKLSGAETVRSSSKKYGQHRDRNRRVGEDCGPRCQDRGTIPVWTVGRSSRCLPSA